MESVQETAKLLIKVIDNYFLCRATRTQLINAKKALENLLK